MPPPSHSSGAVPEIEEEQDVAIGAFADAEAKEEFDFASDSSDDDYRLPVLDFEATRPRGRRFLECHGPRSTCYS